MSLHHFSPQDLQGWRLSTYFEKQWFGGENFPKSTDWTWIVSMESWLIGVWALKPLGMMKTLYNRRNSLINGVLSQVSLKLYFKKWPEVWGWIFGFVGQKTSIQIRERPRYQNKSIKMMVWKMIFLFQGYGLRFYVNLQGCTVPFTPSQWWYFLLIQELCKWFLHPNR